MAKSYPFQVGNLNCATLYDNHRPATLREVFPTVSDDDYTKTVTTENLTEEIESGFNVLYMHIDEKHVLIDSGFGSAKLIASLATLDLSPEAIDAIIITHNDGDHIDGLKNFPNAEIIMARAAWELWTNPESRQGMVQEFIKLFEGSPKEQLENMAASREAHGAKTLPALKDRMRLVEPDEEIFSGLKLLEAFGHRSDHYAIELSSEGATLIHVVDSLRHPVQAKYPWTSFIDSYPEQVIHTNERLFNVITSKNALIFGSHFPFPALARISQEKEALSWQWIS